MGAIGLIGGVVSLIALIVFFMLAARVGAIKAMMEQRANSPASDSGYAYYYEQGELYEFLGDKQKAEAAFKAALFYVNKIKTPTDADNRNRVQIEKKVAESA